MYLYTSTNFSIEFNDINLISSYYKNLEAGVSLLPQLNEEVYLGTNFKLDRNLLLIGKTFCINTFLSATS